MSNSKSQTIQVIQFGYMYVFMIHILIYELRRRRRKRLLHQY